jgi:hypothetical protein
MKGAFLLLGGIPSIGRTILIIMAVGLVLYIIWRYVETHLQKKKKKKKLYLYSLVECGKQSLVKEVMRRLAKRKTFFDIAFRHL